MSVIESLRVRQGFTKAEAELADYLLEHVDDVTHMSMKELAATTYKSNRTIVRLCRKAGSTGWREMRIELAADIERVRNTSHNVDPHTPFQGRVSAQAVMYSILKVKEQALDDCYAGMSSSQVRAVADAIMRARIVYLFARGETHLTAMGFGAFISKIGVTCFPADLYRQQSSTAYHIAPEDLALFVTYNGDLVTDLEPQIEAIREHGGKVAIITANAEAAARFQSFGSTLLVPRNEGKYNKVASFYSQTCLRYALECVYAVIFSQNYAQNLHDKDLIEMMMDPSLGT